MLNVGKIAFIGGGNMAEAIMRGLLHEDAGAEICVAEISSKRRDELTTQFPGVRVVGDAAEAARWGEVVILAIKPQQAESVLSLIEPAVTLDKLVISIMAGIPSSKIEANLIPGCRVIRAMPNTPGLIGAGATAVCSGRKATSGDLDLGQRIFAMIGSIGRPDGPWCGPDGRRDRRASDAAEGKGDFTRRHYHRGSARPGKRRISRRCDECRQSGLHQVKGAGRKIIIPLPTPPRWERELKPPPSRWRLEGGAMRVGYLSDKDEFNQFAAYREGIMFKSAEAVMKKRFPTAGRRFFAER